MAFTTSLSPLITSQLCSSKNGLSSPSHMALAKCVRNGGSAAAGKSAQRMKVSCMATSIPADRVPDMGKRQLPPGSGGAGGGVVAKDALGNDVIASEWIKTHGPDDRTLTQGLKGDPTYLVVEKDKTLATYGVNAVCTHLGTDQTAQANSSTSSGIDYRKGVKDLLESAGPHLQKLPSEFVQHLDQNPMDAGGGSDIPIIDLSGLDGSDQLKASTIKAIGDACAEWGFFRVKNHGIGEKMISEMLGVVDEFFGLSLEEKMKYSSEDVLSPVRYGTSLNTPLAHQLHWRDYLRHYGHPFPDTILQLWPDKPPQYRNVAKTYLVDMWKLTMKLGGAISQSLGLEEGYFERSLGEGVQILACNYYPPCPEPNKTLGLAAHSDHGGLTILMENGVDGLQIKHDGTWLSVQDVPSTFVVNVGDYLEILSNGKYKSIEHRAVVNQHKTRISVAVGHGPEMSTIMRPVAQLANDTDQYRSVTYKDYVKLQQSITSRGKNALEKIKI